MFATLSAKMFASLSAERRANLGRRIALRELVRRESARSAHHTLANDFWCGARIDATTRAALVRISSSGDRAIRTLGRFHDLTDAASHNALHLA